MKKFPSFNQLLLLSLIILVSCSKAKNTNNSITPDPSSSLVSGTWSITSYLQRAEDKTAMFSGDIFAFETGGKLTTSKSGNAVTGTWLYHPSTVGYYGNADTKASITINLGTVNPFDRISKTWNFSDGRAISRTLSLVNPEPAEDEQLLFSKQ